MFYNPMSERTKIMKWCISLFITEIVFIYSRGVTICVALINKMLYFIPSSESSAYLKQIKCILSAVKKYRIFSLVTDTIFIFPL